MEVYKNIEIIDLSESQVEELENALDAYDKKYITYKINGSISIGISHEGTLVAGLDTFSWQGKEFYQAMNYEQAGYYKNDVDNYEEYFFVKRI